MELKTLQSILQEVNGASDLSEALKVVVERVKEVLHADACGIFISNEERGEYVLMAVEGLDTALVGKTKVKYGRGIIGLIGEREEPINIDKATEHPNYYHCPSMHEDHYNAFLGVPMMYRGQLLGVLFVQQKEPRCFSEEGEAFLVTLAAQLAGQIADARAKGALQSLKKYGRKKVAPLLDGVPGAPGIAIGRATVVFPPADLEAVPDQLTEDIEEEIKLFEQAIIEARDEIHQLQLRARSTFSIAEQALFDAYLRILDSRTLMKAV